MSMYGNTKVFVPTTFLPPSPGGFLLEPTKTDRPGKIGTVRFLRWLILFLDKNISYVFITMGYAHGRRTDVRRRKPFNI